MGAVGPAATPWSTNDDLLLKKALEDGASLESLAKGAVQFSRRFTITELQDRWNSLLYDLNTSIEASMRMTEFERSAFKRTSKLKRGDYSKSNEDHCGTRKKKADSVRNCYYGMRKRLRSEPLDLGNISFQGDSYNISGSEAPGVNNMLLDRIANQFELEDTSFDNLNVFPHVMRNKAPLRGVGEFPNGQHNRLEDSMDQNSLQNDIPLGNSMAVAGNCRRLGRMDPLTKLGEGRHIFQAVEANLVSNSEGITSPDFRGNMIFNSPGPDCETSFSPMHYTSTPPAMPDWKEIEVSVQGLPDDANIKGKNVLTGEPFSIADDDGACKGTSECNVINMEHDHMSFDEMKISTDCKESYFVELTDTLFDFTREEILEDAIEKSYLDGLSSLLLNSPYDANDEMPKISETIEPAVPVAYPDIVSTDLAEKTGVGDSHLSMHECTSENQFPTLASILSPQFPEYCDGVICCTLNTEDPEIPCNDHIVFPSRTRPAAGHRRIQNETNASVLSGKDDNVNQANTKGTMRMEPKRFGETNLTSQMQDPEVQLNHKVDDFGVKFDSSGVEMLNHAKSPRTNTEKPFHGGLAIKKESSELSLVSESGNCVVDSSCHVSDSGHLQSVADGINREGQEMLTIRDRGCYGADLMARELGGEQLLSDGSEEQYSESDTDIPSFSDVEAMILDMDLEPDDADSFCNGEVSKYQDKDARAIIRLEQNAESWMHRHIARHGALAMLSCGHSKYYIKKPEVLLGRGADGVPVDIDLGREGCANLISRCQAVIKMDKDGTFYMKNLGRRTIYVNGEKVHREKCVILPSLCSIKITGMWLNFYHLRQCRRV